MNNTKHTPKDANLNHAGIQISALMRAYLNLAGIPWAECEKLGAEFDKQVESADWIDTDSGQTFDRHQVVTLWRWDDKSRRSVETYLIPACNMPADRMVYIDSEVKIKSYTDTR